VPLQNRVAPDGSLHAVSERGLMLGNRGGKFHRDDQTLGRRRHATTHWICCELHYKGRHHEAMGQGYTSLFFLDEVTALAAGHRPCFQCRYRQAKAFLGQQRVELFDRQLHAERDAAKPQAAWANMPDGVMLEHGDSFFAKRGKNLLRWSFAGYVESVAIGAITTMKLLTPPSIIAILANGYQPRWHPSALQWDKEL
jgi:hypothetical protein